MKILNIGSGPVTEGKTPGIEITNADRRDYGVEIEDMEHLTYPDNEFDLVVCVNALDHTPDAKTALQEMIRVSKKWVYVKCWLIQHTTSGKRHFWDMLENGLMTDGNQNFNLKEYGFDVEFTDLGGERRYNYVVGYYSK